MARFAGWEMPLRYGSELAEHKATRSAAGFFDVGHMAVVDVLASPSSANSQHNSFNSTVETSSAAIAKAWLETLVPGDIKELAVGRMAYTMLTNTQGGIIDDLVVSHLGDRLRLVLNASRAEIDLAHLHQQASKPFPGKNSVGKDSVDENSVDIVHREDLMVIALQGPLAADVLAKQDIGTAGAASLTFMHTTVPQKNIPPTSMPNGLQAGICNISRSGYTGEDGFELIVSTDAAEDIARLLLADANVTPAGLVARDSLRLEAGLCLWGNDLDEQTTPVEAVLRWSIPTHRRGADGGYPGADVIARQIAEGPRRRRVGIVATGRRPIRDGADLFLSSQAEAGDTVAIGHVTSGGIGHSAEQPIAMGYVRADCAKPGTALEADVRGRREPCQVQRLPFVAHKYRR